METLKACPACHHLEADFFLRCTDYTVSKEEFQIQSCPNCDLLFTNPRPDAQAIWPYYKADTYVSHTDGEAPGLINQLYRQVRKITLGQKAGLVARYARGKKLVDIGAGTGAFADHMQQFGWEVNAIEPDEDARKQAEKRGLAVGPEAAINQLTGKDVVTMWHVLEHVHELEVRVAQLYTLLKPGGVAIIAVPNPNSWDAQHFGRYWAAYDVPRHLYHFRPKSIRQLFERHGFKSEKTHWMPFDPFYISLLSEQYRLGKPNYISGGFKGLISWFISLVTPDRCSSQIYVFRK